MFKTKYFFYFYVILVFCLFNNKIFADTQLSKKQFTLPQANAVYRITLKNGTIIDGSTDSNGKTVTVYTNEPESMKVKTFNYNDVPKVIKNIGNNHFGIMNDQSLSLTPIVSFPALPYRITLANGTLIEGNLDEDGETVTVYTKKSKLTKIKILDSNPQKFEMNDFGDSKGNPCEFNALGPFLKKSHYPDYKIKRKFGASYVKEQVTLADNIKLSVTTSACIHGPVEIFSFAVPKAILKNKSPKENLTWMLEKLKQLEYAQDYADPSKDMKKLLKKFGSLKIVSEEEKNSVSICSDGTIPSLPSYITESDTKNTLDRTKPATCSWGDANTINYQWQEMNNHIYLIFHTIRDA